MHRNGIQSKLKLSLMIIFCSIIGFLVKVIFIGHNRFGGAFAFLWTCQCSTVWCRISKYLIDRCGATGDVRALVFNVFGRKNALKSFAASGYGGSSNCKVPLHCAKKGQMERNQERSAEGWKKRSAIGNSGKVRKRIVLKGAKEGALYRKRYRCV